MRLLAVCFAGIATLLPGSTRAATFTVTSTNDFVDAAPGDAICASANRVCTLRAAVQEANALPGEDSIVLPAGVYELTRRGRNEDGAASGDLDVTDDLVINGQTIRQTTINGYSNDRVIEVHAAAHLTISNLTITDGIVESGQSGGGLSSAGTLTMSDVMVRGNRARRGDSGGSGPGDGGGLDNRGTASLTKVMFVGNAASNAGDNLYAGSGGGLHNTGTLTLTDVTFDSNQAGDGDPVRGHFHKGGAGGGLANEGTAVLQRVVFSSNSAGSGGFDGDGGPGGGMRNQGVADLSNVTFRANRAGNGGSNREEQAGWGGDGGGLDNGGTVVLRDVRFSRNVAGNGGQYEYGGNGGNGGGMNNRHTATLLNVTFDANWAGDSGFEASGGSGGGLSNYGDATLTNVSSVGNYAGNGLGQYSDAGNGGGLVSDGKTTLVNVTLVDNAAGAGRRGAADGVGENLASGSRLMDGVVLATNTIVAGNAQNCAIPITSLGHNLDSGSSCGFNATGDQAKVDPGLGELSDGLGSTPVLVLLTGSRAIDAGDNTACPATDQRGISRPQGAACDIGAFEVEPTLLAATPTRTATPTSGPSTEAPTATLGATSTPTPTQPSVAGTTPTDAPTPPDTYCAGDCDGDGVILVTELVQLANAALERVAASTCPAGDSNHDQAITIDEILLAVGNALAGCSMH